VLLEYTNLPTALINRYFITCLIPIGVNSLKIPKIKNLLDLPLAKYFHYLLSLAITHTCPMEDESYINVLSGTLLIFLVAVFVPNFNFLPSLNHTVAKALKISSSDLLPF